MTPAWHDAVTQVAGIAFDRCRGAGAVPVGEEIEYRGATVLMKPSTFLALAHPLSVPRRESLAAIEAAARSGKALSPPFLDIRWPDRAAFLPQVVGHEGRHRMIALRGVAGDVPMPVHLFVPGQRSKFLSDEVLATMRSALVCQDGDQVLLGPLFGDAAVGASLRGGPSGHGVTGRRPYARVEPSRGAEACLARLSAEGAATFGEAREALASATQDDVDGWDGWFEENEAWIGALRTEIGGLCRRLGDSAEILPYVRPGLHPCLGGLRHP